jgi:hypothetical protein
LFITQSGCRQTAPTLTEVACFPETLVTTHSATQHHSHEDNGQLNNYFLPYSSASIMYLSCIIDAFMYLYVETFSSYLLPADISLQILIS